MQRFVVMLVLLAFAWPAHAHFIWFVPKMDGSVQVVFSDSLEPDDNVPITKISQIKVFARGASGKADVTRTDAKDHLLLRAAGKGPFELGGVCRYGVLAKKGEPYLLNYYAKTSIAASAKSGAGVKGASFLPLEIVSTKPGSYDVLWQGKPAKTAELVALIPGEDDSRQLKRQDDGTFLLGTIPPSSMGLIGLRAKWIEPASGDLDGKSYKEIRHYSTWTFPVSMLMTNTRKRK